MARDKLSNFLWYEVLVNYFFPKPSGWGTTLSKTHDMPKKSRAAREQPDRLFAILAEHTEFADLI